MIKIIIFSYLALVVLIGTLSNKFFRGTGEDYFVASRSIGPFVLLMSLFGTQMTAFSILGASGESYHRGIGVFGLMASSSALVVPVIFFFIGTRLWAVGKRFGYVTQVQYFRDRWQSDALGSLLFVVLVTLMIPYLLIGVMGGSLTLSNMTNGDIPAWAGGLLVCGVVYLYIWFGGMRGTAWVNTFQTLVFMILGATAYFVIVRKLGGLDTVMQTVAENNPELLIRGERINFWKMLTYTCIPLSAAMFPHLFMHWLSARSAKAFKVPIIFYPICIVIVWVPSVLLGVMGTIDFAGLQGPAANSVLIDMVARYAPGVLGGLLAAGVFAAIMSSLDSQSLSMGTMFTQDIVRHFGNQEMSEKRQVLLGRLFVLAILLVTYALAQVANRSIFSLAVWSFSGFAALLPLVVAALFWKRSNSTGAFASIITVAVLWAYFFISASDVPGYTVGGLGIMPVAVMLIASSAAMIIGSLVGKPLEKAIVSRFFPDQVHSVNSPH